MKKFLCVLCSLLGLMCCLEAQNTIKGTIQDAADGEPLVGATVLIKGTTLGSFTEWDGSFILKTDFDYPIILEVSYIGYTTIETTVNDESGVVVKMGSDSEIIETVEIKGRRIDEKRKESPLTVESLDLVAIKETPAANFYDGLGALKDVDLTAASLGFKVINMRGFNSTSPVRSLQIIDGVDNQSPGLNFSLGNFLGASELDVNKVDLVIGASSAYYGPNAFNGVINMTTKDPFFHKGLSAQAKVGERNLAEVGIRWADAIKNKDGLDAFAYKINLFGLTADDWEAENYSAVDDTPFDENNPGGFDAVNIYGDEYNSGNDFSEANLISFGGLGGFARTGYREIDLVDYDTRNFKANVSGSFRLKPEQQEESTELIFGSSYSAGTTVYQGDNRFSLRNIQFFQNRLEIKKRDKFFFRIYATHEDAGDSYDPYFTALALQDSAKIDLEWSQLYERYWRSDIKPRMDENGYPQLQQVFVDTFPFIISTFDRNAAMDWINNNQDSLTYWHQLARAVADGPGITPSSLSYFEPGTERFQNKFDEIVSKKRTEGGTLFFDRSALYHAQGEYTFKPGFTDKITVGTSARYYRPESEGTIFLDTAGVEITNFEFGLYGGFEKNLANNKIRLQGTIRTDKNENFDWLVSPAASLLYKPADNNYLRLSFSSAIRNPTLSDQYLNLNVGPAILSGNLEGVQNLVTVESLQEYFENFGNQTLEVLDSFNIDPIRPEKVKTIEVGYRTTLFDKLFIDAGYYYSIYNDFLGFNIGVDAEFDENTGFPRRLQAYRYSANSTEEVTTQGFSIGMNYYFGQYFVFNGNYSWNKLITETDDPIVPAFNTPENKYNLGISARDIPLADGIDIGFNVNYKWVEGFIFEGSPQFTGFIEEYDLLDAQINWKFSNLNTTVKLGASNLLNNLHYETYGGPELGRLAYISLLYEFNKK